MLFYSNKQTSHFIILTLACLMLLPLLFQCCATATSLNEKEKRPERYKGPDPVLYYLNRGLMLHYAGSFKESNSFFKKAETTMERLYTQSVSRKAASLMINDYTITYRGEDFENVMTNLFMALNYVGMGQWEEALVEARKVDHKLNVINNRYDSDQKNIYSEDAFVRFLMGVIYESQKEINEAFISYRNAEKIYETYNRLYGVSAPHVLLLKLIHAADTMHFEDQLVYYRNKYRWFKFFASSPVTPSAEVYFLHYNGLCPYKVEDRLVAVLPDQYVLKIAIPKFKRRLYKIQRCEIVLRSVDGRGIYRTHTEIGEDIGSIAIMNLKNRIARIKAKAVARATAKYMAAKGTAKLVKDKKGKDWGLFARQVFNMAAVVTERADLRFCSLLPDRIDIGYLKLPAGTYEVTVNTKDAKGHIVGRIDLADIRVIAGEKKFLSLRTSR